MITREIKKNKRIGVVVSWVSPVSINFVINLKQIIEPSADDLLFVMGTSYVSNIREHFGSKSHIIHHSSGKNTLSRILRYILLELRISSKIITEMKTIDTWIFFKGSEASILPVLIAKIINKRIVLFIVSSLEKEGKIKRDHIFQFFTCFKKINCYLSDNIIIYSKSLIPLWGLTRYSSKIFFATEHIIDTKKFRETIKYNDRNEKIGYFGRFSQEKGILNFLSALKNLMENNNKLTVIFGGSGPLEQTICVFIERENIPDRVDLAGWISHDTLPVYLNQIRLLVIPSYTEGLPNIMLEAMACGTPVLATPVGAIPDIIKDGETGFIMMSNSPECIAENVIRALHCPNLTKIAENGRYLVLENYSFEKSVNRWSKILNKI